MMVILHILKGWIGKFILGAKLEDATILVPYWTSNYTLFTELFVTPKAVEFDTIFTFIWMKEWNMDGFEIFNIFSILLFVC